MAYINKKITIGCTFKIEVKKKQTKDYFPTLQGRQIMALMIYKI